MILIQVDSLEYFESDGSSTKSFSDQQRSRYVIPVLDAEIELKDGNDDPPELTISIRTTDKDDMIFLCTKILSLLKKIEGISSLFPLRSLVAAYYNNLPPSTGLDANIKANFNAIEQAFMNRGKEVMHRLEIDGFVVVESGMKTSTSNIARLSEMLVEKTGQNKLVRSDTVAFITEKEANQFGIGKQYDLLMAISSYLNKHLRFQKSNYQPLPPSTRGTPLSNPNEIQIAEYREGEFYREHSDNSFVKGSRQKQRSNYRCYTCILYCNEDWDHRRDGGALRLYKDSVSIVDPLDASRICNYIDFNPANGVLLIFDSRLIHSVQRVTSAEKKRLAFTVWLLRPEDNGCAGEIYDSGEENIIF